MIRGKQVPTAAVLKILFDAARLQFTARRQSAKPTTAAPWNLNESSYRARSNPSIRVPMLRPLVWIERARFSKFCYSSRCQLKHGIAWHVRCLNPQDPTVQRGRDYTTIDLTPYITCQRETLCPVTSIHCSPSVGPSVGAGAHSFGRKTKKRRSIIEIPAERQTIEYGLLALNLRKDYSFSRLKE